MMLMPSTSLLTMRVHFDRQDLDISACGHRAVKESELSDGDGERDH